MGIKSSVLVNLLVLQCLSILCSSQDFDFFYFVQESSGETVDSFFMRHEARLLLSYYRKPAEDFGIHGLWPNYNTGKFPKNCNSKSSLNKTEIADLLSRMQMDWPTLACPAADGTKFWNHEWRKHGTCSSFDQHTYFQTALDLKDKVNLVQLLANAGIRPGDFYTLESISQAIEQATGHAPAIACNVDALENYQFFQVSLCLDTSASSFIDCPVVQDARCGDGSRIEFPSFYNATVQPNRSTCCDQNVAHDHSPL